MVFGFAAAAVTACLHMFMANLNVCCSQSIGRMVAEGDGTDAWQCGGQLMALMRGEAIVSKFFWGFGGGSSHNVVK